MLVDGVIRDSRSAGVGRNDLSRGEMPRGPRRFAAAGRAAENDKRISRDDDLVQVLSWQPDSRWSRVARGRLLQAFRDAR